MALSPQSQGVDMGLDPGGLMLDVMGGQEALRSVSAPHPDTQALNQALDAQHRLSMAGTQKYPGSAKLKY